MFGIRVRFSIKLNKWFEDYWKKDCNKSSNDMTGENWSQYIYIFSLSSVMKGRSKQWSECVH